MPERGDIPVKEDCESLEDIPVEEHCEAVHDIPVEEDCESVEDDSGQVAERGGTTQKPLTVRWNKMVIECCVAFWGTQYSWGMNLWGRPSHVKVVTGSWQELQSKQDDRCHIQQKKTAKLYFVVRPSG
eukprot:NODE_1477_length_536_cov_103.603696_g1400_i0.p1 GENE.NODE_1477_length_536_cov_103.603696_g1400_i0~~NODE_1477_length_536_cov_103.603696_g1400_i0.p1  ORF type:complete len:128 (+),score=19.11 NODE_1477_length_536_cov_103.603696_g1400_i0:117-500(+)